MSKYWSETVKKLVPYVPGEQPRDRKYIKINTNENPYPPSPRVIEAIKRVADERLKLYPDPTCDGLKDELAKYYGVEKDQVFVGNGSDEILAFSFQAFFNPGNPILFPEVTYSFYPVYAQLFDISYRALPMNSDLSIPAAMFLQKNGGVIFPNPNAPTGMYLKQTEIKRILGGNMEKVVVIDEAYIDFGGESAVNLISEYPNLLVVKTMSKSRALAGLRVGYAFGNKELIEGLERIKNSFNSYTLDTLAIAGALEAIRDVEYFEETRAKIIRTRQHVTQELRELGFTVAESMANFVFASHDNYPAQSLFEQLKGMGILVRYFKKPNIDNYLRISIGTDEEMDIFLKSVKKIISAKK
ncbi:MAG: histidinol-phosphate transaminase [Clostridiales bacterium]|nr:histidinol-phosphate transaminase [Clostridiales bacterium]